MSRRNEARRDKIALAVHLNAHFATNKKNEKKYWICAHTHTRPTDERIISIKRQMRVSWSDRKSIYCLCCDRRSNWPKWTCCQTHPKRFCVHILSGNCRFAHSRWRKIQMKKRWDKRRKKTKNKQKKYKTSRRNTKNATELLQYVATHRPGVSFTFHLLIKWAGWQRFNSYAN